MSLSVTWGYIFGLEEVVVGGGIVVSKPELSAELFGPVDDVHGSVGSEGSSVKHEVNISSMKLMRFNKLRC